MTGLREIWRRRFQFGLITVIVALISYLVLMINGLGIGLNRQAGSAILALDADGLAYARNSDLSVIRSELSDEVIDEVGRTDGVTEWAPLGYLGVNVQDVEGDLTQAALLGYEPGSIGEPTVVEGRPLTEADTLGILPDKSFLETADLSVGDRLLIPSRLSQFEFTIVGAVDEGSFFFRPVIYLLLDSWREVRYGSRGEENPRASIVLVKGEDAVGHAGDEFEIVSKSTGFANIEGVEGQQATVIALRFLGHVIGALVIGIFFYVLTLQKVSQIGLLKALGASTLYIVRQLLAQVLVVVLIGIVISVPLSMGTERALETLEEVPIDFTVGTFLLTSALLLMTGFVGMLFSLRQLARVDPIIALGHQD